MDTNIPLNTAPPTPPDFEQVQKKKIRRLIIVSILLLVLVGAGVFAYINRTSIFLIYYFSHTGTKDVAAPSDPAIGKVLSLNIPMVYSTDELVTCAECSSPRETEINRSLTCFGDITSVFSNYYKDGYKHLTYVPSTTKFTVTEVFKPHHYGITSIDSGPGDYLVYVLKDQNGTLSTALADFVDSNDVCPLGQFKSHIKKLFLFAEKKDKVPVSLTILDDESKGVESTSKGQDRIITTLNTLHSPYHVDNIVKTDSYIPGMKAVNVDVDVNTLAYLVGTQLESDIWEIQGLDPEYQATLTADDLAGMLKKPIDWKNPNNQTGR